MSRHAKSISKQLLPTLEGIQKHFKSIIAQIEGGHLQNAIKTCDKALRLEPNNVDALQTKLVLFLQTEQYKSALDLAELLRDSSQSSFQVLFNMAYALYRLSRESEAGEVVETIGFEGDYEDRGLLHMKAQIEYRRGDYQKAVDLYAQILDSALTDSDEHSDSLINLTAAQTHLDFLRTGFQRSLHSLSQNVANSLEDAPPPAIVPSVAVSALNVAAANEANVPSVKKVRASRVPKGVIPGVTPPPNPERWLKKSQRTNVHHAGKRRKQTTQGTNATQGTLTEITPKITTLSTQSKKKKKK